MTMLAEGENITAVAEACDVSRTTIYQWRASPEGQRLYAEAKKARDEALKGAIEEARTILRAGAVDAARTLVELSGSGPAPERVRASVTILDRVGLPKVERLETVETTDEDLGLLTDTELEQLEALRAKAKRR